MKTLAMMNDRRVSLDFHGVINSNPEFFRELADLWRRTGYLIYVVSGGPADYIAAYLQEQRIAYDRLWCIFDYFNAREKVKVEADGSFYIDDNLWNAAKGKFCAAECVGLHLDDSKVYGQYFTTPYVRFATKEQCFVTAAESIAIADGAESVWKRLSAYYAEPVRTCSCQFL